MLPRFVTNGLRKVGQGLDVLGRQFEVNPYIETLQPATRIVKFGKHVPEINNSFIASSGSVIGKVTIGSNGFVGYGAVVRGDGVDITIGNNVTIGDRAMVHVNGEHHGHSGPPTKIGNNVTVGAGAIIHGCTLEDFCYIGEGAQVMDGAKVSKYAAVAPGSIVTQGKTVPSGQLWSGMPAKYERALTEEEILKYATLVEENVKLSELHCAEDKKDWLQIETDEEDYYQEVERIDYYYQRLKTEQDFEQYRGEVEGHMPPGRVLDSPIRPKAGADTYPGKHWV